MYRLQTTLNIQQIHLMLCTTTIRDKAIKPINIVAANQYEYFNAL